MSSGDIRDVACFLRTIRISLVRGECQNPHIGWNLVPSKGKVNDFSRFSFCLTPGFSGSIIKSSEQGVGQDCFTCLGSVPLGTFLREVTR